MDGHSGGTSQDGVAAHLGILSCPSGAGGHDGTGNAAYPHSIEWPGRLSDTEYADYEDTHGWPERKDTSALFLRFTW